MTHTPNFHELLKKHYGYDDFRPQQEAIINHVIAGNDTLVLMPTGGGKSLCFQLPALAQTGVTIVISPLIALMKDQVDSVNANNIPAAFINSSLGHNEIEQIKTAIRSGYIKLLYIAPERLSNPTFLSFLQTIPVSLIAIDEAHCISEWGHDFRPDYRNVQLFKQIFPKTPIIALTASATPQVRDDILQQLGIQESATIFTSSFNRDNLAYSVRPKRNTFAQLLTLLDQYKGESVIIYCLSRKDTENLAEDLCNHGFTAAAYHAGLSNEQRQTTQEHFINDDINIITATIAFGMGIDKPDVRLVIHYTLPKSMEGYYQETGRAGRDGLPSQCVLFFTYGDKVKQDFFINNIANPDEQLNAQTKLRDMINFCETTNCRRAYILNYFGESWPHDNCENCDTCLTETETFDATIVSQKIFSAILKLRQPFGMNYIIDVLRGSQQHKIAAAGHNQLSVFGCVEDFDKNALKEIIRALIRKEYIIQTTDRFPTITMAQLGLTALQNRDTIILPKPQTAPTTSHQKQTIALDYDQTLFSILRNVRKQIADELGVPPYVVFSDVSLQEMAFYLPQSLASFGKIHGVGQQKLQTYGEQFIAIITEHAQAHELEEQQKHTVSIHAKTPPSIKRKDSTYAQTKMLVANKMSLEEIAQTRGITKGTVIGHLEKLFTAGETLELEYLTPTNYDEIIAAFSAANTNALRPVFERLNQTIPYEDLRLARLLHTIKNR